jgi:hypothetical protein
LIDTISPGTVGLVRSALLATSLLLSGLLAGCGGHSPSGSAASSAAVSSDEAAIRGQVTGRGTKGALLVFAFAGSGPEVTAGEPLSIATVDPGGQFSLSIPPGPGGVTLAFLADGANDGVIDGGDPVAVLTSPALADLAGGDVVQISDVNLDFTAGKASAGSIDARRSEAGAALTPTEIAPAS